MNKLQIEAMSNLIAQHNPQVQEESYAPKGGGGRTWIKFVRIRNRTGDTMKVVVASKTVTAIIGAGEAGDEGHRVSSSHLTHGDEFIDCLRCIEYQKEAWRNQQYVVSETDIDNFLGL